MRTRQRKITGKLLISVQEVYAILLVPNAPVLAFLSEYGSLGGGLLNNVRHGEGGGGAAGQRPHVHHAQDVAPTVPEQLTAYNHC